MAQGDMGMSLLLPFLPGERGAFAIARSNGKLVLADVFTADGTDLGEFNVTHLADKTIARQPVVAAMQGRYIVAWTERLLPEEEGDPFLEDNVKARTFTEPINDPEHDAPGPVLTFGADGIGNQNHPAIAVNASANNAVAAVAWVDDSVLGADAHTRSLQAVTLLFVT